MTKHRATEAGTRAGAARDADQAAHSTPGAERPANRKWRVWASKADLGWWASVRGCDGRGDPNCRCTTRPTWREAMGYVNQQIREQQAARARFIEVRPGATPSATDVRVVFRCPACMSEGAK